MRIIAATNQDLRRPSPGRFREDLYYRLNVIHLRLPPLGRGARTSRSSRSTSSRSAGAALPEGPGFTQEALTALVPPWKGNVRELENLVERAVILARGGLIQSVDLPVEVSTRESSTFPGWDCPGRSST